MSDKYYDIDGIETPLMKLVRKEPDWAGNVITFQKRDIESLTAKLEAATKALEGLVALKQHKSIRGKDQHYLDNQPAAWDAAIAALKAIKESP